MYTKIIRLQFQCFIEHLLNLEMGDVALGKAMGKLFNTGCFLPFNCYLLPDQTELWKAFSQSQNAFCYAANNM